MLDRVFLRKDMDLVEAPNSEMLTLAAVVFQTQAAKLKEALHRVLRSPDTEAVHDVRVSCRRLNVALVTTESLFRRSVVEGTRKRVKDLLKFLGELRDAEVQFERTHKLARKRDTPGLHMLARCLESHKEVLSLRMLAQIEQGAFETLPRLLEVLPLPAVLRRRQSEFNQLTTAQVARRVLLERLSELSQYENADHNSPSKTLHELRIVFKRIRYSADFFASSPNLQPLLGDILKIAKDFQEVLGQLHDADVSQEMLLPMLRKVDLPLWYGSSFPQVLQKEAAPPLSENAPLGNGNEGHGVDFGVLYTGVKEMFMAAQEEAHRLREDFRVLKQSGRLDVLQVEIEKL